MTSRVLPLDERLYEYLISISVREPPVLARLRRETAKLPQAAMQIGPEQGQLMSLLVQILGAKRTLEIGVFTGYSALVTALALPEDGELIACDVSEEWTAIARRYWQEAGVARKIELHLAPAVETLEQLCRDGRQGQFDFAFVDADKSGYARYHELCLKLIRRGGLIAFDNTLWGGAVADPSVQDVDTRALRRFNEMLRDDARVMVCLIPVGDGLTLALKR